MRNLWELTYEELQGEIQRSRITSGKQLNNLATAISSTTVSTDNGSVEVAYMIVDDTVWVGLKHLFRAVGMPSAGDAMKHATDSQGLPLPRIFVNLSRVKKHQKFKYCNCSVYVRVCDLKHIMYPNGPLQELLRRTCRIFEGFQYPQGTSQVAGSRYAMTSLSRELTKRNESHRHTLLHNSMNFKNSGSTAVVQEAVSKSKEGVHLMGDEVGNKIERLEGIESQLKTRQPVAINEGTSVTLTVEQLIQLVSAASGK